MSFERTFLWVSYGLVGVAFLAVALSGELGTAAPVAFVLAYLASYFRRTDGPPHERTAQVWTAVLFVALGGLALWASEDGNWLLHALEFALVMTVSRLFQRRFAQDYLQLYVLSFLLMLVAAVIHPSMVFAVSFVVYAVLTIWALTMVHLVREIEIQTETGPEHLLPTPVLRLSNLRRLLPWRRKPADAPSTDDLPDSPVSPETLQWRRRQLIGGGFLVASSLMAIGALLVSMVFFFLFPRLGMGFFYARTRNSQQVTGFSDAVKLGNFGNIKSSAEVVMRLKFPEDPARLKRSVRMRGLSFDNFDGRNWSRTEGPRWQLQHLGQRFEVPGTTLPRKGRERGYLMHVYLEPLGTEVRVLFAPPRTRAFSFLDSQYDGYRGRRKKISLGLGGDFTFKAPHDTSLAYSAEVVEPLNEARRRQEIVRFSSQVTPKWVRDRWVQLPADVDPRIAKLALRLVGRKVSRLEQALTLEAALRREWTYSLAGDQDPKDPLGDFLFGKKTGHCEYFATSMAVMMRTLGHPARVVNGFLGGQFNDFGDYRMIKQGDAHSWVEVYFPKYGWATFDPTPPAGQLAPQLKGLLDWARRVADGGTMLWYSWVVEYDLERQVAMMRRVGSALRKLGGGLRVGGSKRRRQTQRPDQPDAPTDRDAPWPWIPIGAVVIALGAGFWLWRRRNRPTKIIFDERLDKVLRRVERRLMQRGTPRLSWQTWQVVANRLRDENAAPANDAQAFADAWDRARYGVDDLDARVAALTAADAFERALLAAEKADNRAA